MTGYPEERGERDHVRREAHRDELVPVKDEPATCPCEKAMTAASTGTLARYTTVSCTARQRGGHGGIGKPSMVREQGSDFQGRGFTVDFSSPEQCLR